MAPNEFDQQMMRRAMRLAMDGRGLTEPNPSVGCILVKEGRIVGQGRTQRFGGAHAEPTALASCTENPRGATAYVTLEPCCHTNKKTPPCTPRLIEAGIGRVVVGCLDPNPEVDGKGLAQLRAAGIEVVGPVMEAEAKQLIAPFFIFTKGIPYVTLKWAESSNRKVAGRDGARVQISNEASSKLTHQLRARSDAILVGIKTVLTDDPLLTARDVNGARTLLRIVLDRRKQLPITSRLAQTARAIQTAIYCGDPADESNSQKLGELGVHFITGNNAEDLDALHILMETLNRFVEGPPWNHPVTHLLVEPGPTTARAFFLHNLADRLWVFRSPKVIEASDAPTAATIPENFVEAGRLDLGGDVLTEYLNSASPAFFAPVPSADFVLAGTASILPEPE